MQKDYIFVRLEKILNSKPNHACKPLARINRIKKQPFTSCDQINCIKRALGWLAIASTNITIIGFSPGSSLGKLFSRHMAGRIDSDRLKPIYQNSMVGALRVRACNGSGVSWLPQSLIAADIQASVLYRAGANQWDIGLTINLMRLSRKQDSQLDHIWQHVKTTASAKQTPLT